MYVPHFQEKTNCSVLGFAMRFFSHRWLIWNIGLLVSIYWLVDFGNPVNFPTNQLGWKQRNPGVAEFLLLFSTSPIKFEGQNGLILEYK